MGLGIGGDYPLSAVISSEFASSHIRGRMMTAVFANQGWGQLCKTLHIPNSACLANYFRTRCQFNWVFRPHGLQEFVSQPLSVV